MLPDARFLRRRRRSRPGNPYDPRGSSRSEPDDRDQDISVEINAEDAHHLLDAVSPAQPAFVFPLTQLLPDTAEHDARGEEIVRIYREQGVWPAMARFVAAAGLQPPPRNPEPQADMSRLHRNP